MSLDSNLRSFAAFAVLLGASTIVRVEQVHLETELSKQAVYASIIALGPLFAKDFNGDATVAFEAFAQATEACEKQANELRAHVSPMRNSATSVFERWEKSLEDFSSPNMKQRSSDRLESTRERFVEVQEAAVLAQAGFDELNGQLRDTVLFLGHDFNSTSVAEIEEDAFAIRDRARELGRTFDDCMDAAAEYVDKSALRGQTQGDVDVTVTEK